ncbi:MAG: hypothetical protein N2578_08060, partial [Bdellovibrionaceae bacterium]|nr:hypothetical protein [Pseudobdellovibrionaceae bacterium]
MREISSVLAIYFFFAIPCGAVERKLYVGKNSTEAQIIFNGEVEWIGNARPTSQEAEEQIEEQLQHMFGPMGEAAIKAAPRGEHKITGIKIRPKENRTWVIAYSYKGWAVVHNDAGNFYDVVLPINPDLIYSQSRVGNSYPCTDHHYNSQGD